MADCGAELNIWKRPLAVLLSVTGLLTVFPESARSHSHHQTIRVVRSYRQTQSYDSISYVVTDAQGKPLPGVSNQADARLSTASLAKLMTAYLAFEKLETGSGIFPKGLDTVITVPAEAAAITGSRMGLRKGQAVKAGMLLEGMLCESANDAATALGIWMFGSTDAMAAQMNRKAHDMGLFATQFINPSGQDDLRRVKRYNLSNALDIAELMRRLNTDFGEKYGRQMHPASVTFNGRTVPNIERDILGTRWGLGTVVSGKTGTGHAGHNEALEFGTRSFPQAYTLVVMGAATKPQAEYKRNQVIAMAERAIVNEVKPPSLPK